MNAPLSPSSATAARAAQLLAASRRKSFDPFRDVAWGELDDSAPHLPERYLPLAGTAQWDRMGPHERIVYSRHESAAVAATGVWLENFLQRKLLDYLFTLPVDHPTYQFLLVEVADECRHSIMFSELVRRSGTPAYRPRFKHRFFGRLSRFWMGTTETFFAILAAEELLDRANRATIADHGVHPVPRSVAWIHVIEEARHICFARTYLEETFPRLGRLHRAFLSISVPLALHDIVDMMVNPAVYNTLQIPGGYAAARANPEFRRRITDDLSDLVAFLRDLGLMRPTHGPLWRHLGLVPA